MSDQLEKGERVGVERRRVFGDKHEDAEDLAQLSDGEGDHRPESATGKLLSVGGSEQESARLMSGRYTTLRVETARSPPGGARL